MGSPMIDRVPVWTPRVLAAVVGLTVAPFMAAGQAPQIPRPPRAPIGVPVKPFEYDLAIVRVDSTLRWQGGLEEAATFDVAIVSNGLRDVQQPDVQCTMAGKTFRALNAGRAMKRGGPYQFAVQVKGREAFDITPGRLPVECTASIVQPRGARDGNPANDSASGFVTVDPPPRPDLSIQSVAFRDCDTRGPAAAARTVCAEVTSLNDHKGSGIVTPWTVACEVAGKRGATPAVTPMDKGSLLTSSIRFEGLPAGEQQADCVVDADRQVDETNEANNRRVEKVLVLAGTEDVRYDLAIVGIGTTLADARDETTKQPYVVLEVRLKNLGTQPILQAAARCDLGATGIVFVPLGEWSWSYQPGEEGPFKVQTWGRRLAQIPSGTHEMSCAAGIVQPASVVETNVDNNVMTGMVVVKR